MLLELRIENLLLIERAELRLGPGLNTLTGETGAGKTMLAKALDLLLGGRPPAGIVRPGASEAYVEGVFLPPPGSLDDPELEELRERLPEAEEELVLARRVAAGGRSRAFVQGRSATAADLRELGGRLISFYGQHEHRRLTLVSAQLEALDAYCGPEHLAARREFAAAHLRAAGLRRELDELRGVVAARERDRDLLDFELGEVDELAPSEDELQELTGTRERLRGIDALRHAAGSGAEALVPEGAAEPGGGAAALIAEGERLAGAVAGVDTELDRLAERLSALRIEAEDLGTELRRYEQDLEAEPQSLEEIEERLERYDRLLRKHGGSVAAVLAHAERCRSERDRLDHAEVALEETGAALERAEAAEEELAGALGASRGAAAPRLAEDVRTELSELAMDEASFAVDLPRRERRGQAGDEDAEFSVAFNRGMSATPLRETASGGELSRVMLALLGVASASGPQTLVFDEVDSGVGGQAARAVGEKLRSLGRDRQVLCITHLPQVASLADTHFRIEKASDESIARASVDRLAGEEVVEELCRMLGADLADSGARRHAEELLAAA